jgi:hypothetical protein
MKQRFGSPVSRGESPTDVPLSCRHCTWAACCSRLAQWRINQTCPDPGRRDRPRPLRTGPGARGDEDFLQFVQETQLAAGVQGEQLERRHSVLGPRCPTSRSASSGSRSTGLEGPGVSRRSVSLRRPRPLAPRSAAAPGCDARRRGAPCTPGAGRASRSHDPGGSR